MLNHLGSTYFSVLVNGVPGGFFKPTRGVKQDDPLSPLLFIVVAEVFSRALNQNVNHGNIRPLPIGLIPIIISHLAYADDSLLFLAADCRNLRRVKHFLTMLSGQTINYHKNTIVFSAGISSTRPRDLIHILDMRQSSLPLKYLGRYLHKVILQEIHCT